MRTWALYAVSALLCFVVVLTVLTLLYVLIYLMTLPQFPGANGLFNLVLGAAFLMAYGLAPGVLIFSIVVPALAIWARPNPSLWRWIGLGCMLPGSALWWILGTFGDDPFLVLGFLSMATLPAAVAVALVTGTVARTVYAAL